MSLEKKEILTLSFQYLEQFSSIVKPKPKQKHQPVTKGTDNPVNQSKLEVNAWRWSMRSGGKRALASQDWFSFRFLLIGWNKLVPRAFSLAWVPRPQAREKALGTRLWMKSGTIFLADALWRSSTLRLCPLVHQFSQLFSILVCSKICTFFGGIKRSPYVEIKSISRLHDPVIWYKITHAGTQVAQWDCTPANRLPAKGGGRGEFWSAKRAV